MKNKKNEELNKIDWMIYNFIENNSEKKIWTTQQCIIDYLYKNNIIIDKRSLRKHIQKIRRNSIIQKVILTSYDSQHYGYKLMSEEDEIKILSNRKASILKSLKQYNLDVKRLKNNNQMRITLSDKERDTIESFVKLCNE